MPGARCFFIHTYALGTHLDHKVYSRGGRMAAAGLEKHAPSLSCVEMHQVHLSEFGGGGTVRRGWGHQSVTEVSSSRIG